MFSKIRTFISLAVAVTLICGLIYAVVQQNYRQSANDPQVQISEDYARSIKAGKEASQVPKTTVDIEKSLAPFVIVYDASGKVTATNAVLDGKTPELPQGVLDYTRKNTQDRLTWEPKEGVRIAAVVTHFEGSESAGFVLAGRNMREVEIREERLLLHVFAAWIVTLGATFFATLIFAPNPRKK